MVTIRYKKLASGKFSVYLDSYHDGRRQYHFLKLYVSKDYKDAERINHQKDRETVEFAKKVKQKMEIEQAAGEVGVITETRKQMNFIAYFEEYTVGRHPNYASTLKHLKAFAGDTLPFKAINDTWIKGFQAHMLKTCSANTALSYLINVKAAINQAVKDKHIRENPFRFQNTNDKIKKSQTKRTYLELEELQVLFKTECENLPVKQAFLFSCFTGLRISDVLLLKWSDIKRNNHLQIFQKKTEELLYLPLSDQANLILTEIKQHLPEDEKFVFHALPKGQSTINRYLKTWGARAGILKNMHFHVSRHTFATLSLTHDVDVFTISKLMGHTNIATTQIYADIIDKKREAAIMKLPTL